jgi:hypothetical protein
MALFFQRHCSRAYPPPRPPDLKIGTSPQFILGNCAVKLIQYKLIFWDIYPPAPTSPQTLFGITTFVKPYTRRYEHVCQNIICRQCSARTFSSTGHWIKINGYLCQENWHVSFYYQWVNKVVTDTHL